MSTVRLKARVEEVAAKAGRSVQYLATAMTADRGQSREEFPRGIPERDGITEGLITVLSPEESASFDVRWDARRKRLAAVRRQRRCLRYYLYYLDREPGFMHIPTASRRVSSTRWPVG